MKKSRSTDPMIAEANTLALNGVPKEYVIDIIRAWYGITLP